MDESYIRQVCDLLEWDVVSIKVSAEIASLLTAAHSPNDIPRIDCWTNPEQCWLLLRHLSRELSLASPR
jgi:hypothetical protein